MTHSLPTSIGNQFKQWLYQPILAYVLETPSTGWAIAGASSVHLALSAAGLPSWECPILNMTGIPCPGCGLSRGMVALGQGNWQASLTYHAFSLPILLGVLFVGIVSLLSQTSRVRIHATVAQWENQTGFVAIFLLSLVFYWLGRLFWLQGAFTTLITGG